MMNARKAALAVAILALTGTTAVCADSALAGLYHGTLELESAVVRQNARPRLLHFELEIAVAGPGRYSGTWRRLDGGCKSDMPVEGELRGDYLFLDKKQPEIPGCGPPRMRLTVTPAGLLARFREEEVLLSR
jgi:hypothetical protein